MLLLLLLLRLRHSWKTVPEAFSIRVCLSVSDWVSEWVSAWACECVNLCVPKTLWTPYLKNQWSGFHPILTKDVFGFVDVLVGFWGQKVIGQCHYRSDAKTLRTPYLANQWSEFHTIVVVTDAFGFIDVVISVWDQRYLVFGSVCPWVIEWVVKVTAGNAKKLDKCSIFVNIWANFTKQNKH